MFTVNGSWTTTGMLYDGELGAGDMTVGAGGVVKTGDLMTVNAGTASSFLDINGGGQVTAMAVSGLPTDLAFAVATGAGGTGTVTIEGSGSKLTVNGSLNVGYAGNGVMTVSDGGAVAVNGAIIRLGRAAGSFGSLGLSEPGPPSRSRTAPRSRSATPARACWSWTRASPSTPERRT